MKTRIKQLNPFDHQPRAVACIANEVDYLGDGEVMIRYPMLEIGKKYHLAETSIEVTGSFVWLTEFPAKQFHADVFEELEPYDPGILHSEYEKWLLERLEEGVREAEEGKTIPAEEAFAELERRLRYK